VPAAIFQYDQWKWLKCSRLGESAILDVFELPARMTVGAWMAVTSGMLVIAGPTASGKSAVAMEIAVRSGAEILSVDSMQVYRGMDIGTAKPTRAERAQVQHHLIDVAAPNESFTVARFVEMADSVIASRGDKVPIIVTGGTPLYYKALFEGLFKGPSADGAVRDRLRLLPNDQLMRQLAAVDPPAAARIHVNDSRRLVRALEVFELTGKPISSFQVEWSAGSMRHPATWVGLSWDRELLNRRINARVKSMIAGGWAEETQGLLERYGALSPTASEATGYQELIDHLMGKSNLEDTTEQIKIATRQLARRQMKWFRRWPQIRWIDGNQSTQQLAEQILGQWQQVR
jgi:tRNA dimethylallyltransferase